MADSIREVRAITYEGFVNEAINVGPDDELLDQFIRRLQTYGVSVEGNWRVYWPASAPWFAADGLSERAARIVERLLNDERFMPSVSAASGLQHEPIEGARAAAELAGRPVGKEWSHGTNLMAPSDRQSDGRVPVWMRFTPATRASRSRQDLEQRAEERRVGGEGRSRWSPDH